MELLLYMKPKTLISVLVLLAVFSALGCASVAPANGSGSTFIRAAETKEKSHVQITVAVLTATESRAYFGRPLEPGGVQAIWLKVENRNNFAVWLLPRSTDPDYFSALEVAYRSHSLFSNRVNQMLDASFQKYAIPWRVAPGQTNSGFLFVNLSEGAKFVNIELWHSKGVIEDGFYLELPSGHFDYEQTNFTTLYPASQVKDLTLEQLRRVLETLPCCTTHPKGAYGDPINVILIGSNNDVFSALVRQGWDPTHALRGATIGKTLRAFLLSHRYRYAPVSSLYLFERRQDVAFQKARETVHQRNHMRLWLSPYTYRGKSLWVGQISRDIGIRLSLRGSFFVTHKDRS
jgi:hypothetical protein